MSASGRPATRQRAVRLLRLMGAIAVIVALAAIATIAKGDTAERSQRLVAAAVILGATALLGMAVLAWPYIKKDKNDPRP